MSKILLLSIGALCAVSNAMFFNAEKGAGGGGAGGGSSEGATLSEQHRDELRGKAVEKLISERQRTEEEAKDEVGEMNDSELRAFVNPEGPGLPVGDPEQPAAEKPEPRQSNRLVLVFDTNGDREDALRDLIDLIRGEGFAVKSATLQVEGRTHRDLAHVKPLDAPSKETNMNMSGTLVTGQGAVAGTSSEVKAPAEAGLTPSVTEQQNDADAARNQAARERAGTGESGALGQNTPGDQAKRNPGDGQK